MGVLSNRRGGCLAGTDSPDRLVSDYDVGPVLDAGPHGIELLLEDVIRLVCLSLFKRLTNAEDGFESGALGFLNLLGDDLVSLTVELSALRVADNGPLQAKVNDLLGADLASESSVTVSADVLGGDEHVRVEHGFCRGDVKSDGRDNNFDTIFIKLHSVKSVCAHSANKVN